MNGQPFTLLLNTKSVFSVVLWYELLEDEYGEEVFGVIELFLGSYRPGCHLAAEELPA